MQDAAAVGGGVAESTSPTLDAIKSVGKYVADTVGSALQSLSGTRAAADAEVVDLHASQEF
jgi:hypothetical protein